MDRRTVRQESGRTAQGIGERCDRGSAIVVRHEALEVVEQGHYLLAAHLQTKAESLDAEVSDSPIVTDEHEWPARSGIVDASSHETDDSSLGS